MSKKLLVLLLIFALVFAFTACGSSDEDTEPDRVPVNTTTALLDGSNQCTFNVYDDGTAEALLYLEGYNCEGGTVLVTYAMSQMDKRFPNYTALGYFDGNTYKDTFKFVLQDGEVVADETSIHRGWDYSVDEQKYIADLALLADEAAKIKTAVEEL